MASKVYIADQATQDLINNKVGSPNPTVADETTLFNMLKKLVDTTAPDVNYLKDYTPFSEVFSPTGNGTLLDVMHIAGAGYISSVVMEGSTTGELQIVADGVLIYRGSPNTDGAPIGITQFEYLQVDNSEVRLPFATKPGAIPWIKMIDASLAYTNILTYPNDTTVVTNYCVNVLPQPIFFSNTLTIKFNSSIGETIFAVGGTK